MQACNVASTAATAVAAATGCHMRQYECKSSNTAHSRRKQTDNVWTFYAVLRSSAFLAKLLRIAVVLYPLSYEMVTYLLQAVIRKCAGPKNTVT